MNINYADSCNFKPIPAITPLDGYWQNGTWKFNMSEITAGAASQPSWIDVILKGTTALTLVNAKADGLNYLKLFGGTEQLPETYIDSVTLEGKCEQNGTPTPTVPVDIVCNNGAIKYGYTSKNLNVGELANQGYTSTGGTSTSTTFCGTLWKIKVSEGEKYTISYGNFPDGISGVFVNTWKTDGTWNLRQAISIGSSYTYTIPAGIGEVNFTLYKTGGITIDSNSWIQVEKGETATDYVPAGYGLHTEGTTETVTDSNQLTATAQMLLSVGDYEDTQEVLTGAVTRNVGIKVFDGTENFSTSNATFTYAVSDRVTSKTQLICSHFEYSTKTSSQVEDLKIISFSSTNIGFRYDACADTTAFKAWLKSQYDNGTPVIVVYPTSSSTTETVTPQILQKEPVTVTGSLTGLVANVVSSSHTTPTPQQPLPINTNNGVLTLSNYRGDIPSTVEALPTSSLLETMLLDPNKTYTFSFQVSADFSATPVQTPDWIFSLRLGNRGIANITTAQVNSAAGTIFTRTLTGIDKVRMRNALGVSITSGALTNIQITDGSIYTDGTVETVEVTGKNLFDKNSSLVNGYINSSGAIVSGNLKISPFIEIKPNTTYTLSGTGDVKALSFDRYAYTYTTEQTPIAQIPSQTGGASATFTTAQNAKYIRIQMTTDAVNTCQLELGSTATTYEPYYNGGSATAEMLLKVGDYQDVQSVIDGEVTRKVGVKVLDGTESWSYVENSTNYGNFFNTSIVSVSSVESIPICNYFSGVATTYAYTHPSIPNKLWIQNNIRLRINAPENITTVAQFQQWLADQYNAGTPVIVVYPLAEPTTETVTAQPLTIQAGTNIVEITQASMDNLELEVSYKAGVEVTVTEIENAQLDNSVEVTVNG